MDSSLLERPVVNKKIQFSGEQYRYLKGKRIADFLTALIALVVCFPLFLIIIAILKIEDPKAPAIFHQQRMGQHGKTFTLYKFRSMKSEAPKEISTHQFLNAEQYITKIGRILRKTSIDELPQIINILRGDMSVIGPRPLILSEKEVHTQRLQSGIYQVKPGISGLAQVHGRDGISDECKVLWDYTYVSRIGLKMDILIFFQSIVTVIKCTGVMDRMEEKRISADIQNG